MKKATYFLVYAATAVIGIVLLIFSREPLESPDPASLKNAVMAIGIVFIAAGLLNFIFSTRKVTDSEGSAVTRPWYLTAMSVASAFWGILLVAMSSTFTYTLAVTLGVSLIIAAIAQVIWIIGTSKPYGTSVWWYIVPVFVFGAGIIDITLINDYTDLAKSGATACIISGILLLFFAVNGVASLKRRRKAGGHSSKTEVSGNDTGNTTAA